ncbi:sugar transferase EpsL [Alkalibacillus filiformis]|uniref:Sugar transferase EpsL n=1 Tax=Alkalibacillus filiformis TaxID=200990 RepID=A0ABU0DWG4_9BACI|nr:sugar transferase [Alkalibacillus filiformis]MDQ0352770.1 sugar transferase EpsL [Alkalibacillus filiformis]
MKRWFDLIVSITIAVLLFIPILMVALAILLSMGRPILFMQKRPGEGEKPFYLYKFRSMTNGTDSEGNLLPNEQRITRTGSIIRKLSLDELPQLINVIKGDISLVGPRPLLMEYLSLYSERQAKRHDVKPGITGWAQVNGRNSISWEEKFELDVWYVENRSFLLDMKILLLTFIKVFKREGINSSQGQFVEKFRGE